jgi:hypothetical protein
MFCFFNSLAIAQAQVVLPAPGPANKFTTTVFLIKSPSYKHKKRNPLFPADFSLLYYYN